MVKKRKNKQSQKIFILLLIIFIIFDLISKLLKIKYFEEISIFLYLILGYVYFIKQGKPFSKSWNYLKKIKNYIWFSLILFFIFSLIGMIFPHFFEKQILQFIKELIEKTRGLGAFGLINYIFKNNLSSCFYAMFLGIFFGIVPIITLIINGYVLGFVENKAVYSKGILVLWRLFPHGIFEIPAVMISIGIGLKLGTFIPEYIKTNGKIDLTEWLKDSIRVFLFIVVPLLIIAGIIEGSLIWLLKPIN